MNGKGKTFYDRRHDRTVVISWSFLSFSRKIKAHVSRARIGHWQRRCRCQHHKHGLEADSVGCCESRHFMKQAMRPPRCLTFIMSHFQGVSLSWLAAATFSASSRGVRAVLVLLWRWACACGAAFALVAPGKCSCRVAVRGQCCAGLQRPHVLGYRDHKSGQTSDNN